MVTYVDRQIDSHIKIISYVHGQTGSYVYVDGWIGDIDTYIHAYMWYVCSYVRT